jgi:hypothetical protein
MRGYIYATALREYWKVANWYDDPADLVQDGYLCFAKCRAHYVHKLGVLPATHPTRDQRRHMMTLVKTTFGRYIQHVLAAKTRYGHEVPVSQFASAGEEAADDPWAVFGESSAQDADASLVDLLRSLPEELQQLVLALVGDGAEALGVCSDRLRVRETAGGTRRVTRHRKRLRETTNQYYCRLVGLDSTNHDLAGQVRSLLKFENT